MNQPMIDPSFVLDDPIVIDDLLTRELGDMLEALSYQLMHLQDAVRDPSLEPQRKIAARILVTRLAATFKSVEMLVQKIEMRPTYIAAVRGWMEIATEPQQIKEIIRALGAMRIQDREFDREVEELYREARTRLAVLVSGDLEVVEEQEVAPL